MEGSKIKLIFICSVAGVPAAVFGSDGTAAASRDIRALSCQVRTENIKIIRKVITKVKTKHYYFLVLRPWQIIL